MANDKDYSDSFSEFIRSLGRRNGSSFSKEALDAISVAALKERLGEVSTQKDLLEALKDLKNAISNYSTTLNYSSRNLTKPQQDEIQDKIKAITQIGEGVTRFRQAGESGKLAAKLGVSQEELAETLGVSITKLEEFNKTLDTRVGEELETFAQAVRTSTRSLTQATRGIRKLEDVITLEEAQKATFLQRNLKESPGAVSELLVNRQYLDPGKMREAFGDSFIESVKQSSDLNKGLYTTAKQIQEGTGFFESFFVNTREVSKIQKEALSTFLKETTFTKTEYRKTLTEIDELIKSPKATEEEIAKQVERRRQVQKQLLDVTLEELNIRKKIFQETYGKLGEAAKNFAGREADYIGSTTRNPFWDILTSSLKFGLQTGLATMNAVGSMLGNFSISPFNLPGLPSLGRGNRPGPPSTPKTPPRTKPPENTVLIPGSNSPKSSPPNTTSPKSPSPSTPQPPSSTLPTPRGSNLDSSSKLPPPNTTSPKSPSPSTPQPQVPTSSTLQHPVTPNSKIPTSPKNTPKFSPPNLRFPKPSSFTKAGAYLALATSGAEIAYAYSNRESDDQFKKELPKLGVTTGASILGGAAAGFLAGSVVPVAGNIVGAIIGTGASLLGSYFASTQAEKLYDKYFNKDQQKSQDSSSKDDINKIANTLPSVANNLFDLSKTLKLDASSVTGILSGTSMGGILGLSGLGGGGKFISNFLSGILGKLLPTLAGVGAGTAAFGIDFYLQSLNKSYDIYYSQYTQQNLIPQAIRRTLGNNVADISNALILPGGLLKTGANSLTNLGYTREELLATIPRVTSSMLTDSARSMAEAVKEAGSAARIFGTSISDSVGLIASARKSLIDYKDIFGIARVIAGGENFTQFTKAMTESFINASLSVATRQGANPLAYATSITSLFSILSASKNSTLNELVKNNPDLAVSAFQSINEFIRGGVSSPIAGGIVYRAGLTPRNILQGATPENLNKVLKELVRETGVIRQVVGGKFTSQATEYLLPLLQQQLGLGGISPDIFNEIVLASATGKDALALKKLKQATAKGAPGATSADEGFGKQQEQLLVAYQALTDVMKTNIDKVVALNVAITDLSKNILKLGEPGGQFAVNALTTVVDAASNITGKIAGNAPSSSIPKLLPDIRSSIPNTLNNNVNANQQQIQIPPELLSSGSGYVLFSTGNVTPIPMETLKMYLMQLMGGK